MFKTLKAKAQTTKGIFGKVYKNKAFVYIDGCLINEEFQIIEENISLTRAAKLITGYSNINGRSFFKKISIEDLDEVAIERLTEMGLLNESHQ